MDPLKRPIYNWPSQKNVRLSWQESYLKRFDQLKTTEEFVFDAKQLKTTLHKDIPYDFQIILVGNLISKYKLPTALSDFFVFICN